MILPMIKGIWIPRVIIRVHGYIDGKFKTVCFQNDKSNENQVFYFLKKNQDYNNFLAKCFIKLDKENHAIKEKGNNLLKEHKNLFEQLCLLEKETADSLRDKRKLTNKINDLTDRLNQNEYKILSVNEKYKLNETNMFKFIMKNQSKLEVLLIQYVKGLKKDKYLQDKNIIIPVLSYTNSNSFSEYNNKNQSFKELLSIKVGEILE